MYSPRWLFLLVALLACFHSSAQAAKPNILFLFADDQRADTIAALGNPVIKTPNLDTLAKTGFVFHNAYCMGSTMGAVCNPSRHMLLSGRSLYRYDPKKKEGTFADVFNQAGYVTYHVGKRGNTAQQYHKMFHHSSYLEDQKERRSGHHGLTAANRAINFLESKWDRSKPLCMYIAFEGPHDPRVAAEHWMKLYQRDKIPLPKNYLPYHPFNNGELLVRDEKLAPWPRTEAEVRKQLHDYYGCISSIDHNIGRLFTVLKELKQFDNTIIVFSSDHGLAMGSHGLFGKQSLYEHSMKSPLLIAGPGIPKGNSDALVYLFDIFPTLAEYAGGKVPANLDGKSLVPIIAGKKDGVRETVFLAYRNVQRAVRMGDWKLIVYPEVQVRQLFNLKDDPHELKNLAEMSENRVKLKEMLKLLQHEQRHYNDKAPLNVENPRPAKVDLSFFKK